jgi:hypothetical protein
MGLAESEARVGTPPAVETAGWKGTKPAVAG